MALDLREFQVPVIAPRSRVNGGGRVVVDYLDHTGGGADCGFIQEGMEELMQAR